MILFDLGFHQGQKSAMNLRTIFSLPNVERLSMLAFPLFVCFVLGGCASQNSYTSELLRQQDEQIKRLAGELVSVKAENENLRQSQQKILDSKSHKQDGGRSVGNDVVDPGTNEADIGAFVASNKDELLPEITECLQTNMPSYLMKAYGFQGTVLVYRVTDLACKTNTLFVTQMMLWKKEDGSGEIVAITTGHNLRNDEVVYMQLGEQTSVSAEDIARARCGTISSERDAIESVSNQSRPAWIEFTNTSD